MKTSFPVQLRALLVAVVLPLVAPAASESPSLLLEKGIYAEEIERNLDSAIKIYEQITAEAATHRSVVAQAQYRLAMCYQKQGKKEQAVKILNDLLQQSTIDPATRLATRERLTEWGAGANESFAARRVITPSAAYSFIATSRDGSFLAYWPKDINSVVLHELATGKTWATLPFAKDRGPSGWITALFSSDNQWFAYDDNEEAIFVTKVDGSETKKLFEAQEKDEKGRGTWTTIVGWSGDNMEVFFTSWAKACACRVLYAANVKTGAVREMGRPPKEYPVSALWRFSASGRYLARLSKTSPRTIRVLDLQTNVEEVVASREDVARVAEDSNCLLGWALGDSRLLFTEPRGSEIDVWSIPMKDGKQVGSPELLWRNLGALVPSSTIVLRSGVAADGTLYCRSYGNSERSLWAIEGLLTRKKRIEDRVDIPVGYLQGPDNSIRDQKFGLSATLPAGWKMNAADRRGSNTVMTVDVAGAEKATLTITYFKTTPWPEWAKTTKPRTGEEVEAWLRDRAEEAIGLYEKQSETGSGYKDFKRDPAGAALRFVGDHRAVGFSGSFTRNNTPWTCLVVRILSGNSYAQIALETPSASLDAIRPGYESFVESFRVP